MRLDRAKLPIFVWKQILSEEEKTKFDKCSYEGQMVSDPDSRVSFNQCNENDVKDVTVVSEKVCIE